MVSIDTSIEIEAPAEVVWSVLAETSAYPKWNPFIRRLEGPWVVGGKLEADLQPADAPKPTTFRPTVEVVEPGRKLQWLGHLGVPGIFDGRHELIVEPADATHSRFVQRESFSGLLVPFTKGLLADSRRGFEAMNAELKRRAEELAAG